VGSEKTNGVTSSGGNPGMRCLLSSNRKNKKIRFYSQFVILTEVEESLIVEYKEIVSTSLDMRGGVRRSTYPNAYRARHTTDWTRRHRCAFEKRSYNAFQRMDRARRDGAR
jgi:hypothetical protein